MEIDSIKVDRVHFWMASAMGAWTAPNTALTLSLASLELQLCPAMPTEGQCLHSQVPVRAAAQVCETMRPLSHAYKLLPLI